MQIKLENIKNLLFSTNSNNIKREVDWIDPIGIVFLKTLECSINHNIKIIGNAKSYLDTIEQSNYNFSKSYIPYKNFTANDQIDLIANQITQKLVGKFSLNDDEKQDFSNYINYSISEVMQNVLDHSLSLAGGHIVAQAYPKIKKIQVAISDCGIGFYDALRYTHSIQNEEEAIIKALESNVTGSRIMNAYGVIKNAGIGLFALSKIIEHSHGNLIIISNGTIYQDINGKKTIETCHGSLFKGVVVGFEIYEERIDDYFGTFKSKYLWKLTKEDEIF